MAEILVLAKSIGADGSRTEGDPVAAKDDGANWGGHEDIRVWIAQGNAEADFPDMFYMILIPGMPLVSAERLMSAWTRPAVLGEPEFDNPDEADRYVTLGKYRWQLGVADKLPGRLKSRLRRDKIITIDPYGQTTIDAINSYVTDRSGLDVLITDTPIDP